MKKLYLTVLLIGLGMTQAQAEITIDNIHLDESANHYFKERLEPGRSPALGISVPPHKIIGIESRDYPDLESHSTIRLDIQLPKAKAGGLTVWIHNTRFVKPPVESKITIEDGHHYDIWVSNYRPKLAGQDFGGSIDLEIMDVTGRH